MGDINILKNKKFRKKLGTGVAGGGAVGAIASLDS